MLPFDPTPRNPDDREPSVSVPMLAVVADATLNDEYAVDDEYANVILPVLSIVVVPVPPKYAVYAERSDDDALVNV